MKFRRLIATLRVGVAAVIIVGCATAQPSGSGAHLETINSYVSAYNGRNIEVMSELMHPDIEWLSVDGSNIEYMASGKTDLISQMSSYLSSSTATQSTLAGAVVDGDFVAVREIAKWRNTDGTENSQSALAIYEFENGLIRRVWYYPAQGG